ncbi:MAG TPA: hypothetical protein VMH87_04640, partial [Pseudomonadales bacterium]|nr:hypothetical protein [Pseudomonadales bacterium]
MKKTDWQKLIKASADPARVKNFLNSAEEIGAQSQLDKFSQDSARILVALVSGSQYLGEVLLANPSLFSVFDFEQLQRPRRVDGLRRDVKKILESKLSTKNYPEALVELRRFKQREMLRVASRDLGRLSNVVEITRELSDMADVCLDAVLQVCEKQFSEKYGQPYHQDAQGRWQPTPFCVLGLGKLGGQELNYSSDVDLMFLYEDEGEVFKEPPGAKASPRSVMSNHQYFCKLAEALSDEISRATPDGFFYRVDLRLRPEGDSGPIARSLESCENYYAQWGQTWERMMLIKARHTAGDESLTSEFLEMIQ